VNLGHEIGHIVVEEFLTQQEPKWHDQILKRVAEAFRNNNEDPIARDLVIADLVKAVKLIRRRALCLP
jgi:hypothetical protein